MPNDYAERSRKNDMSRNVAKAHREQWLSDDDEALVTLWDGTEETLTDLAEMLGRTREACRQRYYTLASGRVTTTTTTTTRTRTTTTTTTTTSRPAPRPKWMDDEGLPDYYV